MNTYLKKSIIALAGAAAITLGGLSGASAFQYIPGQGNVPAAGFGIPDNGGYVTPGAGENLASPFVEHGRRSANNCYHVIATPSRYSQDQVSACQAETGTH